MKITKLSLIAAGLLSLTACIKNDIPLPQVALYLATVEGEGFSVTNVDLKNQEVVLSVDEKTDIQNVRIDQVGYDVTIHSVKLDKEKVLSQIATSTPLTGTFDLRTPIYTTLSLYQSYDWKIRAEQTIPRTFAVAGQVGSTEFDLNNRIVTAYVPKKTDLSSITVNSLKLEAADITTYNPTLEELSESSFESVRFVDVTCHGRTQRWLLYVLPTDKIVEMTQIDAWSKVIWLYAAGVEGTSMGFRYRKVGDTDWIDLPATITGGTFSGHIDAEPETQYEVVAYCADDTTYSQTVTTQAATPLVNGGLEEWTTIKDIVYPYADAASPYWGTGNVGGATVNLTITQAGEARPGSSGKYGADLQSGFGGVGSLGKFAAGNLFVGTYLQTIGTNGVIAFGRSYTLRPTALRFWVKYERGIIDQIKSAPTGMTFVKDVTPDNGIVYIALGTWTPGEYGYDSDNTLRGTADSPVCIDTRSKKTFFDANGKDVVAYGEYVMTESIGDWTQVTMPITYKATNIAPTNLMIVCSASRWGDYFSGSTKSHLRLDDMELVYEYVETGK